MAKTATPLLGKFAIEFRLRLNCFQNSASSRVVDFYISKIFSLLLELGINCHKHTLRIVFAWHKWFYTAGGVFVLNKCVFVWLSEKKLKAISHGIADPN